MGCARGRLLCGVFEPVPLAAGASLLVISAVLTASIVYFGQGGLKVF